MIRFVHAIAAAPLFGALALNATSLPAQAQAQAQAQDARTIEVRYADLNLSTAEGRKSLKTRIRSAARSVCGDQPMSASLDAIIAHNRCVTAALHSTDAQVASLSAPVLASR